MSASVSVNLNDCSGKPWVDVLTLDGASSRPGARFGVLHFGSGAEVILPSFDGQSAAYMRTLASALIGAADRLAPADEPMAVAV